MSDPNQCITTQVKSLVDMVSEDILTGFAKSVVAIEEAFANALKPGAQGAEYKSEHFNDSEKLTDAGLRHTRELITGYPAIGNMFISYIQAIQGWYEIKENKC